LSVTMYLFEVNVPFQSVRYEGVGSSSIAQLPDAFELYGVAVNYDKENNIYLARLAVPAKNISEAKTKATEFIRLILSLVATKDLGFCINYGACFTACSIDENTEAIALASSKESNRLYALLENLHLEEHIGIVKKQLNVEFEKKALSWFESWPQWLKDALELNYLSVISHEEIPSFVTLCSALEVMVLGIIGIAPTLISRKLLKKQSASLFNEMIELLTKYSLSKNDIDRLISRMKETHNQSTVDRIKTALYKLGLEAESKDVKLVVRQRGSIIHMGKSSDYQEFHYAKRLVTNWVQTGLRNILEQQVNLYCTGS